jgi:hypothetical protein
MPLNLEDLRAALIEASSEAHDYPQRVTAVERRIKRNSRMRFTAGAAVVAVAAALFAVPLLKGSDPAPAVHKPKPTPYQWEGTNPVFKIGDLPEPPLGKVPLLTAGTEIKMPYDAYYPAPEQGARVEYAETLKVVSCLSQFGIDWPYGNREVTPRKMNPYAGYFGILDPVRAAKYGYGGPAATDEPKGSAKEPRKATKAEYSVYDGTIGSYRGKKVPPGGCLRQARQELGYNEDYFGMGIQDPIFIAMDHTMEDSRVKTATALWRSCMTKAGYDYERPMDPLKGEWPTTRSPAEIKTAKADVACKLETNLVGIGMAVAAGYQREIIAKNTAVLAPAKAALAKLLRNVDAVVKAS